MRHVTRWALGAPVGAALVALLAAGAVDRHPAVRPASHTAAAPAAHPPLAFTANRGQLVSRVRYYAQGNRFGFFLTPDEVALSFAAKGGQRGAALALRFLDRNPASTPRGVERTGGVVNDLRGDDPASWRTGIPQYRQVVYPNLWQGVDLRVDEQSGVLAYEFRVKPGASPSQIALAYAGARAVTLDARGALRIETALGALRDSAPVSFQEIGGRRVPVDSGYRLQPHGHVAFRVGAYRQDRDLVIDPGVQFTTFLGGAGDDSGNAIAVDAAGNSYVAGTTQSPDFPTTLGAFSRTGSPNNALDVFVTKLNPSGTALVYSTFVGGSKFDWGRGISIDAAGNAYVTGQTTSTNFPTTNGAFDRSLAIPPNCPRCASADNYDGFAFKLNPSGSGLVYSTYLGGTDIDSPRGIGIDGAGNAYVSGETLSTDYPTTAGSFSRTLRGAYDVFVTKLNSTGRALAYSTFLGGTQVDDGERVAVDAAGSAYVLGFSSSADFPTTPGAFDTTANGGFDATVTKLNPAGSALAYSTYLGGQGFDSGGGIALDAAGDAYVAGGTGSTDYPTTAGAFDRTSDGNDAFVTKLNPAGSAALYSTVLGGSASDALAGIAVDAAGNAWLTGSTTSADYPVSADAADGSFNGSSDAVISELDPAGAALRYSTFLGGSGSEGGIDLGRDGSGNVYVTGHTLGMDFPATVGAFDTVFNGDLLVFWGDAFVTKLALDRTTSTPVAGPPVPATPQLQSPANGAAAPQPITFSWGVTSGAATYTIQIDDSSGFSAPLVREASVTSPIYATSGLASTTHFWRVRGVNSAGVVGPWSAVRSFTAGAAPPPATLSTLDVNPSSVVGGTSVAGTVVLSVGAPEGGALVTLTSSNPAVAAVPSTVTVPANGFAGTFTITTSAVSTSTSVTITAAYNGTTRTAPLAVTAPAGPPPAAALQGVQVDPASILSGGSASGFVSLTAAAPTGGATVALSSSSPAVTVPASVTVPAGATSASFAVATGSVSSSTPATVTATYAGVSRSAGVTVEPAPTTATLTVTASGRGGERVSSSPAGISVATGSSGSAPFAVGTSITLSATNGRSVIWSGACSSGGSKVKTCTFTLNGAASVTANVQ